MTMKKLKAKVIEEKKAQQTNIIIFLRFKLMQNDENIVKHTDGLLMSLISCAHQVENETAMKPSSVLSMAIARRKMNEMCA